MSSSTPWKDLPPHTVALIFTNLPDASDRRNATDACAEWGRAMENVGAQTVTAKSSLSSREAGWDGLPQRILVEIINCLQRPRDRGNFAMTCRRWREVVGMGPHETSGVRDCPGVVTVPWVDLPPHVVLDVFGHLQHPGDRANFKMTCRKWGRAVGELDREAFCSNTSLVVAPTSWADLPNHIVVEIFSHLRCPPDRLRVGLTCRKWQRTFNDPAAWRNIRLCPGAAMAGVVEQIATVAEFRPQATCIELKMPGNSIPIGLVCLALASEHCHRAEQIVIDFTAYKRKSVDWESCRQTFLSNFRQFNSASLKHVGLIGLSGCKFGEKIVQSLAANQQGTLTSVDFHGCERKTFAPRDLLKLLTKCSRLHTIVVPIDSLNETVLLSLAESGHPSLKRLCVTITVWDSVARPWVWNRFRAALPELQLFVDTEVDDEHGDLVDCLIRVPGVSGFRGVFVDHGTIDRLCTLYHYSLKHALFTSSSSCHTFDLMERCLQSFPHLRLCVVQSYDGDVVPTEELEELSAGWPLCKVVQCFKHSDTPMRQYWPY